MNYKQYNHNTIQYNLLQTGLKIKKGNAKLCVKAYKSLSRNPKDF